MSDILIRLKEFNKHEGIEGSISGTPLSKEKHGIPTLDERHIKPFSPQLLERFKFCGEWTDATFGLTWLGLDRLEELHSDQVLKDVLNCRMDNWGESVFDKFEYQNIALFGVWEDEFEEAYLVWVGNEEPMVFYYTESDESIFQDLNSFICYYLGDDSMRIN